MIFEQEKFDKNKLKSMENLAVFKFVVPNGNDYLSKMDGNDLQKLIVLMDEYYLELRPLLGIDDYITFGLELEFEHLKHRYESRFFDEMKTNKGWKIVNDRSLDNGYEIVSPILMDELSTWNSLTSVCSIIRTKAKIGENSGGHIHIGVQTLGDDRQAWLNFFKIWSVYENIIYRFCYGEFLTARPNILNFAIPKTKTFWNYYEEFKKNNDSLEAIIKEILYSKRYQAVNFSNINIDKGFEFYDGNTIEFRCPNGSLEPAIWQNNLNLLVNLLNYARSSEFNDDLVKQRYLLSFDKLKKLEDYNEIYLEQVLEFCDMIFTNNFDKICFLRQYLKSYEVCKKSSKYSKALVLTRK